MKKIAFVFYLGFVLQYFLAAQNPNHVHVSGYTKSNGTYVMPHYRTAPNNTINDNFSTRPNINPYTGKQGTISPTYTSSPTYNYSNPSYNGSSYTNTTAPPRKTLETNSPIKNINNYSNYPETDYSNTYTPTKGNNYAKHHKARYGTE